MGRELKRVDINNPPPVGEVWSGFLNPFYDHCQSCPDCDGGYSATAARYCDEWYGNAPFDPLSYGAKPIAIDDAAFTAAIRRKVEWSIELAKQEGRSEWYTRDGRLTLDQALRFEERRMFEIIRNQWCHHLIQEDVDALIAADRLRDLTSTWSKENGWKKKPDVSITAEEVNAWSLSGMSHDSINQWVCVRARCERDGEPETCHVCDGSGERWESAELQQKAEDWTPAEPPSGNAYQIWETVSEGSPVSPAFSEPEELARWMVQNDTSVTRDSTFEDWMRFIDSGWSPSMVASSNGLESGVKALSKSAG